MVQRRPFSREVFRGVVDDVVEADAAHHLVLERAVDASHFDVMHLGELDADRADPAARPVDENLLTRSQRSCGEERLHGELSGLRKSGRLLEGHASGLRHETCLRRTHVLGKASPAAHSREVAVDLVARPEAPNGAARSRRRDPRHRSRESSRAGVPPRPKIGNVGCWSSPQSQSLSEQAWTCTSTWSSFGTGRATSLTSSTSGEPYRSRISAFISAESDCRRRLARRGRTHQCSLR